MDTFAFSFIPDVQRLNSYIRKWRLLLIVPVIVGCGVTLLKYAMKRQKYSRMLPSKSTRWIDLVGNLTDYLSAQLQGLPANVYILQVIMGYCKIFKKQNCFFFWLSYIPFVVVYKADAVEDLISGSKHLEKTWVYNWLHPWLGTGLLTSHGSKWKTRRKLLTPSFHFEILKDFLPVFNEQSQILVQRLLKETEAKWTDITKLVTLCSLDIVCETTLGAKVGAQINSESEYVQAVSRASETIMSRFTYPPYFFDWYFKFTSLGIQFKKDIMLLHGFTRKVISEKKQQLLYKDLDVGKRKRKALMDLLLEEHVQNKTMTEEDIREEIDTFAFEGHDTTSMGMSWALYMIGLHPEVQEHIHEELDQIFGDDWQRPVTTDDIKNMEYLDRVLKESQRLFPSVPGFGRQLQKDANVCGYKIPKDCGVIIFTYALHRDETVFPNPEKFDPDRFLAENSINRHPFAYIPFSAGPRNCIGQRFAVMEEKVVLANILRRYTLESVDPRDKVLPAAELILRAAKPIRVKIGNRKKS